MGNQGHGIVWRNKLPNLDWRPGIGRSLANGRGRGTDLPLRASFFCCFSSDLRSFLSLRSRSLRSNSSAGIGSPEQVCGCALCAGRPGPFFVCSFLRHLARRF